MDVREVEAVAAVADMIQIGARNMQNYALLTEVGRTRVPVLIKRGLSSTIEELLMASEYVLKEGNADVVLCERGIRTFETAYRFTLDLAAVPVLKSLSHLPVIVDPSHAAGRRDLVEPLALAAAAVGADGIIVEIHPDPDTASATGRRRCAATTSRASPRACGRSRTSPRQPELVGGLGTMVPVTAEELASGVRDRRIERVSPLTTPKSLIEALPLDTAAAEVVVQGPRRHARDPPGHRRPAARRRRAVQRARRATRRSSTRAC